MKTRKKPARAASTAQGGKGKEHRNCIVLPGRVYPGSYSVSPTKPPPVHPRWSDPRIVLPLAELQAYLQRCYDIFEEYHPLKALKSPEMREALRAHAALTDEQREQHPAHSWCELESGLGLARDAARWIQEHVANAAIDRRARAEAA